MDSLCAELNRRVMNTYNAAVHDRIASRAQSNSIPEQYALRLVDRSYRYWTDVGDWLAMKMSCREESNLHWIHSPRPTSMEVVAGESCLVSRRSNRLCALNRSRLHSDHCPTRVERFLSGDCLYQDQNLPYLHKLWWWLLLPLSHHCC